jgi:hypothetical protein
MSKFYFLRQNTDGVRDRNKQIPGIAEQKIFISEVRFGETVYPFQQNIEAYFVPSTSDEPYCFCVDDFLPHLFGEGKTPQEARSEWEFRFHLKFQELYTQCDFERSEGEVKLWSVFEEIVDIPAYRVITPLSFQVTGKFVDNPGVTRRYREIEWIDGTKEIVDSRLCPREFVIIPPGRYFESTILRGYHNNKILKVLSIQPVDYQDFTGEEIDVFLNSLPTSKELPDSTRWK